MYRERFYRLSPSHTNFQSTLVRWKNQPTRQTYWVLGFAPAIQRGWSLAPAMRRRKSFLSEWVRDRREIVEVQSSVSNLKSCRICERYQGKRWSSSCMNFRIVRSVGRNVLLGMCFLAKIAIKSYWGMIKVFGYVYRMISSALALKADNIAVSESWLWPLRRATRLSGCLMVMLVCSTEMLRPKISESSASSSSMGCS